MEPIARTYLDHGAVVLLDIMGSDQDIANAARISYSHGNKQQKDDVALLRYLVRHRHTSPLEQGEVKFYLKIPIFVARQLIRHRTANVNELSGRYSVLAETFTPTPDQCGPQSHTNKQGRQAPHDLREGERLSHLIKAANQTAESLYQDFLSYDMSREMARIILPVSTYTEMYWKCDVHNFLHFCKLRLDHHAQHEIRLMAELMYGLVKPFFPIVCNAFEDYILNARSLSAADQLLLKQVLHGYLPLLTDAQALGLSEREYNEFMEWIRPLYLAAIS